MLNRLRNQLILVIMLVAVVPLAVVGIALTLNARNAQQDAALDVQNEAARRLAEQIETFITNRPRELRLITGVRGLVDLPLAEQRAVLSELLTFDDIFEEFVLLDAQGREVIRESKRQVVTTELGDRSGQAEYLVPFNQQIDYYSPVQVNPQTGELLMTISIPLENLRTGNIVNVLVADFRFKTVTELLQEEDFRPGEDIYLVQAEADDPISAEFVDDPELVIAHENPSVVLGNATVEIDNIEGTSTGLHGDEIIAGLSSFSVGDQKFTVVAELTTQEAFRAATRTRNTLLAVVGVVLVLTGSIGLLFARRISRPVVQLSAVAERLGSGDLDVEAKVHGSREITTLASAFNTMAARVRNMIGSLEDEVTSRTQDLFLTLEVGQLSARIYQQAELLPRVTDFIRERFDLYYTQVYLVDEAGRYAYLEAGTGEVGQQLLERGHRLDLSEMSIVARTYQTQRPVLVSDTKASDLYRPNPLLPETRSEIAIPLIVGDQILGVLDMQARDPETFREDNLPVFEAMANQLASALRSAQAYEETRIAIERADDINRRLTGEAWSGYLSRLTREKAVGYRYDLQAVAPLEASVAAYQSSGGNGGNGRSVRQPVLLRDEPIGTIQLMEDKDREWSAEDLALIEAVADRVALALDQFRAFDETQHALNETAMQAQRLSLLNDLAAEISAAETLADVYRVVAVRTDEVLTSDRASIALLTPSETQFEIFGLDGEKGAIPVGAALPREGTWLGEVVSGRYARSLKNMNNASYRDAQQLAQQGLHSSLNAPLIVRGRAVGVLNVARTEVNAYSQRDEDLLTQIASLLSAQIENRGLLEQAQKRAAEMQTVAEVGTEASSALDPDELLWSVVNLAKERFNLYHAHIYLTDDTGEVLTLAAGSGEVGQQMAARRRMIPINHEHSLVARVARNREGLIVNDVTQAPDFLPNPMLPYTRSELAVPLIVGNQLLGVLDVQSNEVGRFDEEDLRVQGTLASQIAATVQNARLFAEGQARERQFSAVFEGANDAIFLLDPRTGQFVSWNQRTLDYFGAEPADMEGTGPGTFSPPIQPNGRESDEMVAEAMALVSAGEPQFFEWLHRRKDGSEFYADVSLSAIEVSGEILTQAVVRDVTERREAQAELDNERRTLQTVLMNLPVGVFMADAATGGGLLANEAALEMLGRGLDPASSTTELAQVYDAYQLGTNDLYPVDQMPLVRGMQGETVQIDDMEIRRPDGKRLLLEVTGAPIMDTEGNVTASLAVFSDITERRRAEEERQQFLIETQARYEAGRQLVAATNYDDILRAISRYSFRDGAVSGTLLTIELGANGQPEWAEIIANDSVHEQMQTVPVGTRFYLPDFPSARLWIADPDQPQLVSDVDTDKRLDEATRELYHQGGQRAVVTLPLIVGGQWAGLAFFSWEQPHVFTDSEERFYRAMSTQVASVLQGIRLLEVTERRASEMATVAQVGAEAATSLDPNQLLIDVTNLTKERFNLYHAHIYLLDETGRNLRLAAGAGTIGEVMARSGYQIAITHSRSLVARAARSREGVIVDDVTQADDFLPNPMLPDTRSEMAIPMIVGDRVIGVLDVQASQAAYFDVDEMQVLSTLAAQIAVAVNNARLYEAQVGAARQREALNELSQTMLAAETPDAIFATVADALVERFDMAFARIWTVDRATEELVLQVSSGIYTHLDGAHSRVALDSDRKLARIARDGAPYITNDLLRDPWIDDKGWAQETSMTAFAGYPLFAGDELVGIVGMFSYDLIRDDALPVLQSMTLQIGTAIQSLRLFEQVTRRALEMQLVAEVGAEASATLDPDELLWTIANRTKEQFNLYHVHIYLLDDSGQNLRLAAGAGEIGRVMVNTGHRIAATHARSLVARAARGRAGVIVNDVTREEGFLPNPMLPQTRSEMAIPMLVGDQVLGVLDVQADRIGRFSESDIQVMSVLTAQIASAAQNARLFSEAQQRLAIIEAANNAVFLANTKSEIIYLNPYALQWLGYDSLDEVVGKTIADLRSPDAEDTQAMELLFQNGRWSGEFEVQHRDGHILPAEMTAFLIYDDAGNPEFIGNIMTDITERRRAERERIERENLLRSIIDTTPDWIFVKDNDYRYLLVNQAFADFYGGRKPEEMVGLDDYELGTPVELVDGDPEQGIVGFRTDDRRVILEHETVHNPDDIVDFADGTRHVLDTVKLPLRDATGGVIGVLGLSRDVTESRRAEQERVERENLLRAIIDSTPDWIFVKDQDFRIQLVNKGMSEALGVEPNDLIGKDDFDMGFPEHLIMGDPDQGIEGFRPMDQRVLAGEVVNIPYDPVMYANGDMHILDTLKTPLRDADGNVISLLGVGHDVTERERLMQDLQNTSDALADRIKELAALQDVGAYGEENLALEEYLTRVANRIPSSMQFPDMCVSVIEYGDEVYGDARALDAPVSLANDLEVGNEVYGRLVVGYTEQHEFQAEEIPHLRDIAGRISSYLENRQLFEQTQQALAETELLYNASRRIVDASTIQELVAAVATAVPITAINRAVMFTFETDDTGRISTAQSIGNWFSGVGTEPTEVGRVYDALQVPTIDLMVAENALFINNVVSDDRVDPGARAVFSHQNITSVAVLPLWVGRRQVGTLLLETEEEHEFTPDEIRPFEAMAGQMASALDSLLLLEQTQKRAAEMQTVAEVGAEAAASLDPDRLLKSVSELTKDRFGLYHAHVYLLDDERNNLVLRAGSGDAGEIMTRGGHRIPLAHQQSLVVQAALTQRPIIANNVTQAPDFLPNPMLPLTRAELATPMIAAGEVIGVLDVQADQVDFFTQEDMQVQMTLASQVAVAVQNARLFSEQVAVAEQLREVDRLKSEFLASMSHELRTPLNSIIGYAEVLLDGIDGDLTDDMEEDVGAIHGSGKHLLNLINDILDLAKIEAGQMDLVVEDFDLMPVAEDMASTNRILLKDKSVDIVLDIPEDLPRIHADSLRIRQVVSNLLTNAIKFTEEGSITIQARPFADDPHMVQVAVIDTGMGMNRQQLQVIFDRFRQVDQSHTRRAGGTGLGLSITRQLIQMHGGDIWVESEPGMGSTFAFTLPFAAPEPVDG